MCRSNPGVLLRNSILQFNLVHHCFLSRNNFASFSNCQSLEESDRKPEIEDAEKRNNSSEMEHRHRFAEDASDRHNAARKLNKLKQLRLKIRVRRRARIQKPRNVVERSLKFSAIRCF